MELSPFCGLLWFKNHLFVKVQDSKIKQIDASTGSTISEWSVPPDDYSRIALPQHGQFLAYSSRDNITLWDISTHIQLGLTSRSSHACSIAFSPSGRHLALIQERKIIIKNVSRVKVRPLVNRFKALSHLHLVHKEPDIHIENAALEAWENVQLVNAEALLSTTVSTSKDTAHILATRALVRARLQQWDAALVDAEKVHVALLSHIHEC